MVSLRYLLSFGDLVIAPPPPDSLKSRRTFFKAMM
jgi:hypothetical protein